MNIQDRIPVIGRSLIDFAFPLQVQDYNSKRCVIQKHNASEHVSFLEDASGWPDPHPLKRLS